ncbi:MAG: PH domain-containing protein [Erysipelotrichaceae bacterium]|nr:PH domain-containing protein [Erysipelotrichaceae bacterium]
MPTVSSGIVFGANTFNLKEIQLSAVKEDVFSLLVEGEEVECAFMTVRDQVIFTNKRIFVVNVQGLTGKKVSYLSYPYSKVQYYGIETAGLLDIDSELILAFNNGANLQFDFKSHVDIKKLSNLISQYVL